MDHLIYASKGHIPNLGPLGPLLHVEKFVVGANFSVKLEPQAEQYLLFVMYLMYYYLHANNTTLLAS